MYTCPEELTIELSGITRCGDRDYTGYGISADDCNGLYTLSNGGAGCTYSYSDSVVNISLGVSETAGYIHVSIAGVLSSSAEVFCLDVPSETENDVYRGGTFGNMNTCGSGTYNCVNHQQVNEDDMAWGEGGTCTIY